MNKVLFLPMLACVCVLGLASKGWSQLADTDGDGVNNYREEKDGTDPNNASSFNSLSRGLVADYPFDGDANDHSGYSNNGSIVGMASITYDRFDRALSALSVAKDTGMVSQTNSGVSGSTSLTLSVWMKPEADPAYPLGHLLRLGNGPSAGSFVALTYSPYFLQEPIDGQMRANFVADQNYAGGWTTSDTTEFTGRWSHIVATFDNTSQEWNFYIDGKYQTNVGSTNTHLHDLVDSPLYLNGAFYYAPDPLHPRRGIDGAIDDVRVYTRALSASDVSALYQAQSPTGDPDNDQVNNYREVKDGTNPNDPISFNPLSKGLIAYYPFDGSANDESGYDLNFSSVPALTPDRYSKPDMSAHFTSASPIQTSAQTKLGDQGYTVAVWLRLEEVVSVDGERLIMHGSYAYPASAAEQGAFSFAIWPDGSGGIAWPDAELVGRALILPPGTFSMGEWHHFACVADGSSMNLFVDGILKISAPATIASKTANLTVGGEAGVYFDSGSIDDARIYNRPLSTSDIQYLYNSEAFNNMQRTFLTANPSIQGHFSAAEYNANRTNGQADVTTNPAAFNLFTQEQHTANYGNGVTAGIGNVLSNPASYSLYTSDSIMDLRMGGLILQKQGSNAIVTFQPQTTTDLTQPFTNNGTAITNVIPMPSNKGFIRINAKP